MLSPPLYMRFKGMRSASVTGRPMILFLRISVRWRTSSCFQRSWDGPHGACVCKAASCFTTGWELGWLWAGWINVSSVLIKETFVLPFITPAVPFSSSPSSPLSLFTWNKPLLLIVLYQEDCAFIFILDSLHNWDAVLLYLDLNKVTQRNRCSLLYRHFVLKITEVVSHRKLNQRGGWWLTHIINRSKSEDITACSLVCSSVWGHWTVNLSYLHVGIEKYKYSKK